MAPRPTKTNPAMIAWAIDESGYDIPTLAGKLDDVGVSESTVEKWISGSLTPTRGQLTKLTKVLKRQRAVLYMQEPPRSEGPQLELRRAAGDSERSLTPEERVLVRKAISRQEFVAWLLRNNAPITLPQANEDFEPSRAAASLRSWLKMRASDRKGWNSDGEAYRAWKHRVEGHGILVMELRLGAEGIRGFSVSDSQAPLVAVNTAYTVPARLFTLLHELAHLMLKSSSSCLSDASGFNRSTESWCDRVAGACLLPLEELLHLVQTRGSSKTIEFVREIASEFRSSLRAAAIALGEIDVGFRDLYRSIRQPIHKADTDQPKRTGGRGQQRPERRFREVGLVVSNAVVDAVESGEISELEARRALKLDGYELDVLGGLVRQVDAPLA